MNPLKFEPIFKSMLWGGCRLPALLRRELEFERIANQPIGEAWVLSDVDGSLSVVANGEHRGRTLRELIQDYPREIFGKRVPPDGRFPLLFKFIDAKQELSVQVHPNDAQAVAWHGSGHRGKTEAWVILDADVETSRIYAGVPNDITPEQFRQELLSGNAREVLHNYTPRVGDCIFLDAGTIHAIGADLLLFEVQQTSDITYRLYDWGRIDHRTGQPRELHLEAGLACANLASGPCDPVEPVGAKLVSCPYFSLERHSFSGSFTLGEPNSCQVLVVLSGKGTIDQEPAEAGDVFLLPALPGRFACQGGFDALLINVGPSCSI